MITLCLSANKPKYAQIRGRYREYAPFFLIISLAETNAKV